MTDKELLELAAKAAGLLLGKWVFEGGWMDEPNVCGFYLDGDNWNPLTDDGDAQRLMVNLRLEISWWKSGVSAESQDCAPVGIQPFNDDPYAATRRAIVRAAAEVGKAG